MAIAVHAALVVVGFRPVPPVLPDRPRVEDVRETRAMDAVPVLPEAARPKRPSAVTSRPIGGARRPMEREVAVAVAVMPSDPPPAGASVRPMVEDVLYGDDGRPRLPDEPIYAATKAPPDHYRMPGTGGEDDVFYRPPVLEPQEDRIALRWEPTASLGNEWYQRLVRATTLKTAIPLGPKFSLVCGASLAGLGGGCVIRRDGGTGVIVHRSADPPPWEKARSVQCRGLRDDLAAAEDPERVAWLLDRLLALCSGDPATPGAETTTPGAGPGVGDAPERSGDQSAEPDR